MQALRLKHKYLSGANVAHALVLAVSRLVSTLRDNPALFVDDEKACLDVTSHDPIPNDYGATLTVRMAEKDSLSGGESHLRVGRAEPLAAGIEQAAPNFERAGFSQIEPYLTLRRLAVLAALFRYDTSALSHATEVSTVSPYTFSLRLRVREEMPSSFAALYWWPPACASALNTISRSIRSRLKTGV